MANMKHLKLLLAALFAVTLVSHEALAQRTQPNLSISKKLRPATQPLGATDYLSIEQGGQNKFIPATAIKKGTPFAVTVPGVNLATVANTPLLTIPAGVKFYAISAKVETTTAGATTAATVSVGSTGTSATSIVPSGALNAAPTVGQVQTMGLQGTSNAFAAADVVNLYVTVGAGTPATNVATIHLIGYYL